MIKATEYINMDEQARAALCRKVYIEELAQRIIDVDYYGAQDADATIDTVAADIENSPLEVINYLLDFIEELQG